MKQAMNDSNDPDAKLGRTLEAWEIKKSLPLGFERQVWRRIEAAKAPGAFSLNAWFAEVMSCLRVHRGLTVALVMLSLVIGVGGGMVQARRSAENARSNLSERYVQSIDPYLVHSH